MTSFFILVSKVEFISPLSLREERRWYKKNVSLLYFDLNSTENCFYLGLFANSFMVGCFTIVSHLTLRRLLTS